jgi:Holliday junction resolvasome RuvABC endonuclease subunit
MRILSLDTGLLHCGWIVLEDRSGKLTTLAADVIELEGGTGMERASRLAQELYIVIREWHPNTIVYEGPSLPRNAGSAWKIGLAFGVLSAILETSDAAITTHSVSPLAIKKALLPGWESPKWGKTRAPKTKKEKRELWHHQNERKSNSKEKIIAVVKKRLPDIVWPKRTTLHEHIADAAGAAITAMKKGLL